MTTLAEIGNAGTGDAKVVTQSLTQAFAHFTEVAGSLERSYRQLETEASRLRHELEERNADLAHSLEENRSIRLSLDRIFAGLPCGVLVAASDGVVSSCNPAAGRLLETEGRAVQNLRELRPELIALFERARLTPGELESEIPTLAGSMRCVSACCAPLGPEASDSVFILQDVSHRIRLAREHEQLDRQQALARLSAVLAHEVRNPLGSLELFAGLLAESDLEAEHHDWVEQIQAGLRMLAATVNNVLHFHSLPSPQKASLDLGELLVRVSDFLKPLARRCQVQLHLDNRLEEVELTADRHRLEQVLLNLVLNALRFMPEGGSVWISGALDKSRFGTQARIEVSDSGPGIAPEDLPRIFAPGFTTRTGSPGLGLAVCRNIVEQHGGTIEGGNRAEGGAQFTLRLPLGEAA
ncbi:MAG TPA: ATP-binding protein [Terriglobales bacterium]|jgi:two-component system sensor histidine kinase FlrB